MNDLDAVIELFVLLGVGAGAEALFGYLLIARHLVGLIFLIKGVGGGVRAGVFGAELSVEDVLLLEKLHNEDVLGVDHLHHLYGGREVARIRSIEIGIRSVGSTEPGGPNEGLCRGVHCALQVLLGKNNVTNR